MKVSAKDRADLEEIREGWLSLVLIAFLLTGQELGRRLLEPQWSAIVAIVTVAIWLVLRPWRFGLLSGYTRTAIRQNGGIAVVGFGAISVLDLFM